MIELFDEVLRRLITAEVADGTGVEISFEAPTREWGTKRNVPTLDLYLYDVREDLSRREVQWADVRDATGRVVGRRPPPRRYRLSYLVTAWTQRPEDEHRLLSACLGTFLRHETLPPSELTGALVEQPIPVELDVALPPGPTARWPTSGPRSAGSSSRRSTWWPRCRSWLAARRRPGRSCSRSRASRLLGRTSPAPGRRRRAAAAGPRAGRQAQDPPEETVAAGSADQPGRTLRLRGSAKD